MTELKKQEWQSISLDDVDNPYVMLLIHKNGTTILLTADGKVYIDHLPEK